MIRKIHKLIPLLALCLSTSLFAERMDELWGDQDARGEAAEGERGQLFSEGKYAMFVHWGLYSQIANKWQGRTYYGIGEWIMNRGMAHIPYQEYMAVAEDFNPVKFDADAMVQLAKDAGMRYIVITSKHHDGFAMYHSQADDFNIVDATPFDRDPLKELAEACAKHGIGLGFYYSHNMDWTSPGATGGPSKNSEGEEVDFSYYFKNKLRPQIEEITSNYGPIELVWFDTPGGIPRQYAEKVVEIVRKNQPGALVSGRVGHRLGDYASQGDMEIPNANIEGMWETVDTTNDSWSYAWYDNNWKTPREIVERLVSTVARGGTYMLNIGPRGDGSIPEIPAQALRTSGEWLERYPYVIYGAEASPWGRAMPWGDVTARGNLLYLSVFTMPDDRILNLPGLETGIESITLIENGQGKPLPYTQERGWTRISLPLEFEEPLVPVLRIELSGAPEVDNYWGIDPAVETILLTEFAEVENATKSRRRWMEKFGEWKHTFRVFDWQEDGRATWEVDVLEPGYYHVDLTYTGEGRLVWRVSIDDGDAIQNQQNSSHNFQKFPIGWIEFPEAGRYTINVSCIEGNLEEANLQSIHFTKVHL